MAVTYKGSRVLCLATDTKPSNMPDFTELLETDTLRRFLSISGSWYLSDPYLNSAKKYGAHALNQTQGEGIFTNETGTGLSNLFSTSLKRKFQRAATTATAQTWAGKRGGSTTTCQRVVNPRIEVECLFNTNTLQTWGVGFIASTTAVSSHTDPLNALAGIFVGTLSGDTQFYIIHNDASGVTVHDLYSTGFNVNTAQMYKIKIWTTDATPKFSVQVDSNPVVDVTSDIPAQTTGLVPHRFILNNEAVDKQMDIYDEQILHAGSVFN